MYATTAALQSAECLLVHFSSSHIQRFCLEHPSEQVQPAAPAALQQAEQPSGPSVLEGVLRLLERLLGAPVQADQPFMEAGLDSLALVELRSLAAERFGVELPPTAVFDHPTARALTRVIQQQLPAPQVWQYSCTSVLQAAHHHPARLSGSVWFAAADQDVSAGCWAGGTPRSASSCSRPGPGHRACNSTARAGTGAF